MGADSWAKRRGGASSESPEDVGTVASASTQSADSKGVLSVSSASSGSFEDDKFHLPTAHRPFMLLPGWDKTAPPEPPPQAAPPAQEKDSSTASKLVSKLTGGGGSDSGGDQPAAPPPAPPPPPPPPGFSCSNCAMFRAHGNGGFGCESKDFQRYMGTDRLVESKSGRPVLDPTRSCSDWFQPAAPNKPPPVPTRHNQSK
jgi:hypothetical protein